MEIEESRATGWIAWVLFGGVLLVLLGALHLSVGLIALLRPEFIAGDRADLLTDLPLTAVGWIHIAVGALALATGPCLIRNLSWARSVTVGLAVLAAVINFVFLGIYPVWSVIGIALSLLIAWAVVVHGDELAGAYGK
ncbi:membrane protein [Actinoplanes cyaneus]|uniref:Membrane protein n=1 Tax=Actinoplanes cyaneus TaxID=52696 RepID=A0A919IPS1_9ACTN|nr:hypothetical protein [Actinoplanes cyaneus]MCW2141234.1 hypothetical protein [Actinoplanes cyaneus]GID67303.1 membrane protein [Actinoplanes cyaneus]